MLSGLVVMAAAMFAPVAAADAAPSKLTRYSAVDGCFALQSQSSGEFLAKGGGGYVSTAELTGAERFRLQATTLGEYLFYGTASDFMAVAGDSVAPAAQPSPEAEWTLSEQGSGFTIVNAPSGRALALQGSAAVAATTPAVFDLVAAEGCPTYPEVDINASGGPSKGPSTRYGEVSGLVDSHMHGMAFEFLGGRAHCGRPWHKYGAPYALVDCADHEPNGCPAVLENALYGNPARCHDTVGWPTFKDWPAHDSLTHESFYYRWLERSWRGGLRLYTNLMVENSVLCKLYPYKQNSCDEMESVLLQIEDINELQDYIDAQSGGPGKGWFRIVESPQQARKQINKGNLAVVLGMEVSDPFGCSVKNDFPECDKAEIDFWLDKLHDLGLRQFEIVNKFDNALTGVAGDSGETGALTNGANFINTGKFWDLEGCADPENHDKDPTAVEVPTQDAMIGNGLDAFLAPGTLPVYDGGPYCNQRGLTTLGEYTIRQMMKKKMIFDPDHMSVIARDQALNVVESKDYSGIVSSHSWSTENALPRIYRLGGLVTPYAGDSESFVEQWRHLRDYYKATGDQYFGVGYGADANGFGSQGAPRGADVPNPVAYPFESFDGKVTLDHQVSGERVYDINTDGVAHYGLYPDWIEDLRMLAGEKVVRDMGRGAEAYLQMWERAEGIRGVGCKGWSKRFLTPRGFKRLRLGAKPNKVLRSTRQPFSRTRTWRWCAEAGKGSGPRQTRKSEVAAVFDKGAKVALIASNSRKHRAEGIRPGEPASALRGKAKRVGASLYVREAGRGRQFVYGVEGKRVRFVALASRKAAARPGTLKRYIARTRLR